jgi:hypothetical protein
MALTPLLSPNSLDFLITQPQETYLLKVLVSRWNKVLVF